MNKLAVSDIVEALDKELIHRYSRYYRCESSTQNSFERGVDAGICDARQAMIKVLQDYRNKESETCSYCQGEGIVATEHIGCSVCDGTGKKSHAIAKAKLAISTKTSGGE